MKQNKKKAIRIGAMLVAAAALVLLTASAQAQADISEARSMSSCDRFIEEYTRSSARKLWRGLSRGEYGLKVFGDETEMVIEGQVLVRGEDLVFDVLTEAEGRVMGLVDRRRQWEKTFLVADTVIGPVVVSQTWQPRHLREAGQPCEPIMSTVEWPKMPAPSVDIEPFRYWGLRISWKIPPQGLAEMVDREVEEILIEVLRQDVAGEDRDDE